MHRSLLLSLVFLLPLGIQAQQLDLGPAPPDHVSNSDLESILDGNDVILTHSFNIEEVEVGFACAGGGGAWTTENNYWRVFDLEEWDIEGDLLIDTIIHGVGHNTADNDQFFMFHELDGELALANVEIIDMVSFTAEEDDHFEIIVLDTDSPVLVEGGSTLAVQLHIPHSEEQYNARAGFNWDGQTDPTYVHTPNCAGLEEPVALGELNSDWEDLSWVLVLLGKEMVVDTEGSVSTRPIALGAAYPNPATGQAVLPITLDEDTHLRISIHDMLGREVGLAFNDVMQAGDHSVNVNTGTLASGTYVVRMVAGAEVLSSRIVVVN